MCWMKRSNTLITQVLLFEPCKFHHSVLNDRVTFYQDYLHSAIACRNEPSRWQFAVFKKDSKIQRKANKTSWTRPTKSQSRETQSESSNLSVLATTKAATAGPRFCCRPRSSLNAATPSYHIPKNKTKNIHQTCFFWKSPPTIRLFQRRGASTMFLLFNYERPSISVTREKEPTCSGSISSTLPSRRWVGHGLRSAPAPCDRNRRKNRIRQLWRASPVARCNRISFSSSLLNWKPW